MTQPKAPLARQDQEQPDLARLTPEVVSAMTNYSLEQMRLITKTVAKDAPLVELASFLHACNKLRLDPLLRQAYWIRRKSREQVNGQWQDVFHGTLQIAIDGFRSLADRQGNYLSSDAAEFRDWFEYTDKKTGEIKLVPGLARVITRKVVGNHVGTFVGEARWSEFFPGEAAGAMWLKMPTHMLAKCAEAQSLRKGWPALLGGVEMMAEEPSAVDLIELPEPPRRTEVEQIDVRKIQAQAAATADRYRQLYDAEDDNMGGLQTAPPRQRQVDARAAVREQPDPRPEPEPAPPPDGDDDAPDEPAPQPNPAERAAVVARYNQYLAACKRALGDDLNYDEWGNLEGMTVAEIELQGARLTEMLERAGEAEQRAARQPRRQPVAAATELSDIPF